MLTDMGWFATAFMNVFSVIRRHVLVVVNCSYSAVLQLLDVATLPHPSIGVVGLGIDASSVEDKAKGIVNPARQTSAVRKIAIDDLLLPQRCRLSRHYLDGPFHCCYRRKRPTRTYFEHRTIFTSRKSNNILNLPNGKGFTYTWTLIACPLVFDISYCTCSSPIYTGRWIDGTGISQRVGTPHQSAIHFSCHSAVNQYSGLSSEATSRHRRRAVVAMIERNMKWHEEAMLIINFMNQILWVLLTSFFGGDLVYIYIGMEKKRHEWQ